MKKRWLEKIILTLFDIFVTDKNFYCKKWTVSKSGQSLTSHQRINPPLACMESGSLPTGHCALCLHHAESVWECMVTACLGLSVLKTGEGIVFPFHTMVGFFFNSSKDRGPHFLCWIYNMWLLNSDWKWIRQKCSQFFIIEMFKKHFIFNLHFT